MTSPDAFIRLYDATSSYSTAQWVVVAKHVITKLEEFLGTSIRYDLPLEQYVDDGIIMDIDCEPKTANGLGLHMRGILTSSVEGAELSFGATVFLYCSGKKLNANTGESFIDLRYQCNNEGGRWTSLGWFIDHYGEYPEFDEL
jgi:hypothetical protein